MVLRGESPQNKPPRVQDFDELDKKSIDSLVDYMKYVATASGITMGFYARNASEYMQSVSGNAEKIISFAPILFWFLAVLFSVMGIFPRTYVAQSDYEKEKVVMQIRRLKSNYSIVSVLSFLLGFMMFVYVTAAQIWKFYPFS